MIYYDDLKSNSNISIWDVPIHGTKHWPLPNVDLVGPEVFNPDAVPFDKVGMPQGPPQSGSMLWAMAMVPGGFPGPGHDCFVSASRESRKVRTDFGIFWRFVTPGHSHELTGAFWIEFARDESCSHFIIRFCRFLTLHKKAEGLHDFPTQAKHRRTLRVADARRNEHGHHPRNPKT